MDSTLRSIFRALGGGASALYEHRKYKSEEEDKDKQQAFANKLALEQLANAKAQLEMTGAHYKALEAADAADRLERMAGRKSDNFRHVVENTQDTYKSAGVYPTYGAVASDIVGGQTDALNPRDYGEFGMGIRALQGAVNRGRLSSDEIAAARNRSFKERETIALRGNKGFVAPDWSRIAAADQKAADRAQREDANLRQLYTSQLTDQQQTIEKAKDRASKSFDSTWQGSELRKYQQMEILDPDSQARHDALVAQREASINAAGERARKAWEADYQRVNGHNWSDFGRHVMSRYAPNIPQSEPYKFDPSKLDPWGLNPAIGEDNLPEVDE